LARSRNLGDVLHYFIPEDEQSAAREREVEAEPAPTLRLHGFAPRICIPTGPDRLLWCALALELAGALASESGSASVEAGFPASALWPSVPGVRVAAFARSSEALASVLNELRTEEPALVLERPERLAAFLVRPERSLLDGLLLPVDASTSGVGRALRLLREVAPVLARLPVLTWVIGARTPREASELAERLAAAARRQHGLDVEVAAALPSDPALFRALLRGESVHASDDGTSPGARELRALSRRLALRRAA
jgi:hypothetical protein